MLRNHLETSTATQNLKEKATQLLNPNHSLKVSVPPLPHPNLISCMASATCQIDFSPTQTLMTLIKTQFINEMALLKTLPPIHISGCRHSCSIHQLAQLGFYGGKKRIDSTAKEAFMLCINGSKKPAVLAEEVGTIELGQIPAFLYTFAKDLQAQAISFQKDLLLTRYSDYFV